MSAERLLRLSDLQITLIENSTYYYETPFEYSFTASRTYPFINF